MKESIRDALASWGLDLFTASDPPRGRDLLKLKLALPDRGEVRVGVLTQEGREFVFRYDSGFGDTPEAHALPGFPAFDEEYRSSHLWPFFQARLPPIDRADVRDVLARHDVDRGDTLRVLGTVSREAVASPYIFEFEAGRRKRHASGL